MFWKSPTPHEESLAKIDEFLRTHQCTPKQLYDIRVYYGGDKRVWGLRHLRLTAAARQIHESIGQPVIHLK